MMRLIFTTIILTMLAQPVWAYTMADLVWIEGKFIKSVQANHSQGELAGNPYRDSTGRWKAC